MSATAFYDGQCIVCQTIHTVLGALDWRGNITWVDLHNKPRVQAALPEIDYDAHYDELMYEIHVKSARHGILRGFEAARHLLGQVPLGVPLWALMWLPGIDWLGDKTYKWVSANRYRVNKWFGRELEHLNSSAG